MNIPPVDYIELNMSNYSDDDVSQLNEWAIWAHAELDRMRQTIAGTLKTVVAKNADIEEKFRQHNRQFEDALQRFELEVPNG